MGLYRGPAKGEPNTDLIGGTFPDMRRMLAWTLAVAIAIGYILSRSIAKAGSAYRDHEHDH